MPKGDTWLPSSPKTTTTMLMLLCYVVVMLFTPKRPNDHSRLLDIQTKPSLVVTFFSLCTTFGNRQTAETLSDCVAYWLADWLCVKAEICYDSNTMVMA